MRYLRIAIASLLAVAALTACDSGADPPAAPGGQSPVARTAPDRPDMEPLVKGPASPEGYQAILATSDLAVGENRIGFVLTSEDGFVTVPAVRVTPRLLDSSGTIQEEQAPVQAMYQAWPYGNRGLHAARISFARPGRWELSIQVEEPGKPASAVKLTFDVRDSTLAPNEGESAVKSRTRTASDVKSLAELTTGSLRDGDLYQVSIADAVSGGKPAVVVFASPAFCINAVCGPQVDVLQELKNSYKGQGSFIHVDFYENPDKIQGDLGRAQVATAVKEWKLPSIEWTFVIDKNGVVRARFEGFATYSEVEQAFKQVL